jgi:hypothetical protein
MNANIITLPASSFKSLSQHFKKSIRSWRYAWVSKSARQPHNYDMAASYRQDANDLSEVYRLWRAGKIAEAGRRADSLDTLVRDIIPQGVWEIITDATAKKLRVA